MVPGGASDASSDGIQLRLSGVTKRFGGVIAVSDVSMAVRRGEIMSIIGPNGAGKTSLLNVISGFYVPDHGAIRLEPPHANATISPGARSSRTRISSS